MTIARFSGEYRFLSNFHPCYVIAEWLGDGTYPPVGGKMPNPASGCFTVECAYQAMKAKYLADFARICGMAPPPGVAKRMGRRIELRPNWDDLRVIIMRGLVLQKFATTAELRAKLLATGDEELVEGNHWGDTFWGVCRDVGENRLGRILMEVRTTLR